MTQLPDDLDTIAEAIAAALRARRPRRHHRRPGAHAGRPDPRGASRPPCGEPPVVDPELEAWLREPLGARGLPFSDVNLKQAWLIPSATALANPNGTAPGWWVETRRPGHRRAARTAARAAARCGATRPCRACEPAAWASTVPPRRCA